MKAGSQSCTKRIGSVCVPVHLTTPKHCSFVIVRFAIYFGLKTLRVSNIYFVNFPFERLRTLVFQNDGDRHAAN